MTSMPAKMPKSGGRVEVHEIRTQVIDVFVDPIYVSDMTAEMEVILRINGRPVSRMNRYRAERLNLIEDRNRSYSD
jgi:hypothetical protein